MATHSQVAPPQPLHDYVPLGLLAGCIDSWLDRPINQRQRLGLPGGHRNYRQLCDLPNEDFCLEEYLRRYRGFERSGGGQSTWTLSAQRSRNSDGRDLVRIYGDSICTFRTA